MTKQEVIDLIKDAGYGLLATAEGPQPRVRPMMPYLTDDVKELLFACISNIRTIDHVKENPHVEICFVDRKMWYCRISGVAEISEDNEKKEILWNNIPMLKQYFGGIDDPNFVLMTVKIKDVEAMTPHQMSPEKIDITS